MFDHSFHRFLQRVALCTVTVILIGACLQFLFFALPVSICAYMYVCIHVCTCTCSLHRRGHFDWHMPSIPFSCASCKYICMYVCMHICMHACVSASMIQCLLYKYALHTHTYTKTYIHVHIHLIFLGNMIRIHVQIHTYIQLHMRLISSNVVLET